MGDVYTNPPQSRNEAILRATIDGTEYTAPPQSRIEDLLLELKEAIEQGGGAGGMSKNTYDPNDVVADAGGIAAYVDDEITELNLGTASTKNSTSVVTDSSDLVESGAVKNIVGWGNKNLCRGLETGSINQSTGQDQTGTNKRTIGIVSIKKGSTVTISGFNSDSTPQYRIFYFSNGVYQSNEVLDYDGTTLSSTVTVGSTIDGIRCQITPAKVDDTKFMVEYGAVASTYEPYHESVSDSLDDKMSYADNGILGSKNLYDMEAVTQTVQGITYTPNLKEGSIAVSGTVSDSFDSYPTDSYNVLPTGRYILNGLSEVTNIGFNTLELYNGNTQVRTIASGSALFDGCEFEILQSDVYDRIHITFKRIASGSCSGTIKPMIRRADDPDETFQPYAGTNRQLTVNKTDNSVIGNVENAAGASQEYRVNQRFILNGKFRKAKSTIAQGEPITDTNSEVESIASALDEISMMSISNGTDLNNLKGSIITNQRIYYANSTTAATLSNVPISGIGFRLEVKRILVGADRFVQLLYPNSGTDIDIWYRNYTSSGWSSWNKLVMTV